MDEWRRALELIEGWIVSISQSGPPEPPDAEALEADDAFWVFQEGSASIFVWLYRAGDEADLHIYSPILLLPEDPTQHAALFERMLRLNSEELRSCAFAINNSNEIVITATRSTTDISMEELAEMALSVSGYADQFDDELFIEFGAEKIGRLQAS